MRGRNLISAQTDGLVALRAPTRVTLAILSLTTSRDEATGIEELTFTVRVTAAPPLAAMERVAIQVLASHRPGAASDGVFESSRQLFIVLPRALPVTIAFTDTLAADRPNLVIVAGRNLEGCSLDFGEGVTLHMQRSEDRTIAGVVTVTDTQASTTSEALSVETVSKQLTVRSAAGDTVNSKCRSRRAATPCRRRVNRQATPLRPPPSRQANSASRSRPFPINRCSHRLCFRLLIILTVIVIVRRRAESSTATRKGAVNLCADKAGCILKESSEALSLFDLNLMRGEVMFLMSWL